MRINRALLSVPERAAINMSIIIAYVHESTCMKGSATRDERYYCSYFEALLIFPQNLTEGVTLKSLRLTAKNYFGDNIPAMRIVK